MSGVVHGVSNVVQDVVKTGLDTVVAPGRAIYGLATGGNPLSAAFNPIISDVAHPGQNQIVGPDTNILTGINNTNNPNRPEYANNPNAPPTIAIQDPAQIAAQNTANSNAAARAAYIAQAQAAPGRGGTILTDSYMYRT